MILAFDVGNTETTIGLCVGTTVRERWRVTTEGSRTPDEVHLLILALLSAAHVDRATISGSAIASVVPSVTAALTDACRKLIGAEPIIVDGRSKLPITLDVDEPQTVGADRIVNTLAASRLQVRLYRGRPRDCDHVRLHYRRRRFSWWRHRAWCADVGRIALSKNVETTRD